MRQEAKSRVLFLVQKLANLREDFLQGIEDGKEHAELKLIYLRMKELAANISLKRNDSAS